MIHIVPLYVNDHYMHLVHSYSPLGVAFCVLLACFCSCLCWFLVLWKVRATWAQPFSPGAGMEFEPTVCWDEYLDTLPREHMFLSSDDLYHSNSRNPDLIVIYIVTIVIYRKYRHQTSPTKIASFRAGQGRINLGGLQEAVAPWVGQKQEGILWSLNINMDLLLPIGSMVLVYILT